MKFLGIDPGLRITGYGCIHGLGVDPTLVEAGVFRLGKGGNGGIRAAHDGLQRGEAEEAQHGQPLSAAAARGTLTKRGIVVPVADRLVELDADFGALLSRLRPDVVAVESLFAHYKHPATAIAMGHARGVILLAVRKAGLELVELKPNEVKKFLTGHGHASKEQMQKSVQMRLGLACVPEPPDVADAIAIGLCAAARR